jgi:lysyl-tRNA synthetase class 1
MIRSWTSSADARPERRATYSPFLPISPRTGRVLQVPMIERNPKAGTVVYVDPDTGEKVETKVTGGAVKCQWKADWALRWTALGVDYEMAGKDLIDSVTLSSKICRALGATPPEGFQLRALPRRQGPEDLQDQGNGLSIEEWLTYASPESLFALHVSKAEDGEAALFRRDPARRRRVSHVPREVSFGGAEAAPR